MGNNILIVDDAAFMRMMVKDILTKGGYNVVGEAENGVVAVQKYSELKPDLVTLDITMPEMDGIQALKKIKEIDAGKYSRTTKKRFSFENLSSFMYVSIDLVEEIIERQLRKYKNKIVDRQQAAASLSKAFVEEEIEDDDEIKIIRSKRFAMKPMDPEEACVQMELLGHDFYVFRNAISDEVNVVYKRKDHTFGLIEPEF